MKSKFVIFSFLFFAPLIGAESLAEPSSQPDFESPFMQQNSSLFDSLPKIIDRTGQRRPSANLPKELFDTSTENTGPKKANEIEGQALTTTGPAPAPAGPGAFSPSPDKSQAQKTARARRLVDSLLGDSSSKASPGAN